MQVNEAAVVRGVNNGRLYAKVPQTNGGHAWLNLLTGTYEDWVDRQMAFHPDWWEIVAESAGEIFE